MKVGYLSGSGPYARSDPEDLCGSTTGTKVVFEARDILDPLANSRTPIVLALSEGQHPDANSELVQVVKRIERSSGTWLLGHPAVYRVKRGVSNTTATADVRPGWFATRVSVYVPPLTYSPAPNPQPRPRPQPPPPRPPRPQPDWEIYRGPTGPEGTPGTDGVGATGAEGQAYVSWWDGEQWLILPFEGEWE